MSWSGHSYSMFWESGDFPFVAPSLLSPWLAVSFPVWGLLWLFSHLGTGAEEGKKCPKGGGSCCAQEQSKGLKLSLT